MPTVSAPPYNAGQPTRWLVVCKLCGDGYVCEGEPAAPPRHGRGICDARRTHITMNPETTAECFRALVDMPDDSPAH